VVSEADEISIGSSEGNDLVLTDSSVSRHHCVITERAKGFWIKDLDSTNGIVVGGHKVGSARLKSGSSFKLGRTTLRFDALDEEVSQPLSRTVSFADVMGQSAAMRRIFATLPRIAAAGSTVLLEGETGTGKSLVAAAIHEASPRASAPLVVVDCASVSPTLIESQLFGHKRGAYTGAHDDKPGAFVAAQGGTLFLDEVGELPLELQPKLLRVLEERVVTPVGSTTPVAIDVRVVAATNRDLREEVNRGGFRADLFYRLNVVRVHLPPLRERPEDIELLVDHFYGQFSPDQSSPPPEMLASFKRQRWSGNVRELRSAVERAILLGDAAPDQPSAHTHGSDPFVDLSLPFRSAKDAVVSQFEKAYLAALIHAHGGNISKASRAARMDRNHLRELLRRHDLLPI
jgi:DNA-binding NtrC family response regulator